MARAASATRSARLVRRVANGSPQPRGQPDLMSPAPSARLTRFLDADARRPAWVPLLGGFLGRFGAPYQAISADRTALGNALRDAARLLGSDIHVVLPDPTLLADALGAHVDWTSHDLVPVVADAPWSAQIPSAPPAAIASSGRLGAAL